MVRVDFRKTNSQSWFKPSITVIIVSLALISILAGCQGASTTSPAAPTSGLNPTAAGTITESGSATVQPLAEKLANAFSRVYPEINVIIQGGGSSVGIRAAFDGTVDFGAASRELTESDPQLVTHIIARDGIAIIVNSTNPISGLTTSQVRDIFSGKITNWLQVGGTDREIHIAAREEGSGTRTAFEEMIMGKDTRIQKKAILQSSNGILMHIVNSDPAAISFVSFGYLVNDSVKALAIDGAAATEANAANGIYPVVRPLYFLTKDQPQGLVKMFLDYCASPEAQEVISAEGYIIAK